MSASHRISVLGVSLLVLACGAAGGVYDDVTAWWQLDFAGGGGVGAATEIRDARTWYTADPFRATSLQGTPEWTTDVPAGGRGPAGGQVYGGRALSLSPAVTGGIVTPDGFHVDNLAIQGDATLVTRFKWDGYADPGVPSAWLYNNAHTAGGGWLLGLNGGGANPTLLQWPTGALAPGWTTAPGTWYDLAVVIDNANDQVSFYRWAEGGALESQNFSGVAWDFNAIGSGTRVGFEWHTGGNAQKAFAGTVDHIAVWNRALAPTEVAHALGFPQPLGAIGIDNDSGLDFNLENAAGNTYNAGEPWGKLSRALTQYGNSQIDINLLVTAEQAGLPYVFHLDAAGGRTPTFPMSVAINGLSLGTQDVVSNGDAEWVVPGGLVPGANTLSLRYTGPYVDYGAGGSYIVWDWMELGGAWQVGLDNDSNSDFEFEGAAPDDFYVTDPNWKHVERAVSPWDPTTNFHFELSPELAAHPYRLSLEVYGPENPETGFEVYLNDALVLADLGSHMERFAIDIPRGVMQAGDNVVRMQYAETDPTKRWIQWDWLSLQPRDDSLETQGYWMVGLDNDSNAEFAVEWEAGDDFLVGDLNWKHLERAVTPWDSFTNLHFALDPELAGHSFNLAFEVYGPENPETGFEVYLNDVRLLADLGSHGELFSLDIPWTTRLLQPGDNVLRMQFAGDTVDHRWIQWDWIRMEALAAQIPEPATLALLGLGALLLRRRRPA